MLYSVNSGSKTTKPNEKAKWRTIKEHPNYMVSSNGDVYSKATKKIMSKWIKGKYFAVTLTINNKKTYYV